ncbi:hypothetical protein ACIQMV_25020 [Streptomyces sp. NPDC091412]|uniref:hypothetical protein n=1 Tax=Streptomyces sp. NPDC091412 TaxID=3366002 RepID=UPI00383049F1
MIMTRSTAVTAAISAASAIAATGITYAAATPASVPQTVPAVAQQAPAPDYAPMGGEGGQGKGNEGGGRGGEGGERGEHGEGGERGEHGKRRHHEIGRIFINERTYSAAPDGCITVVSGLGSKSLNVRNESKRTVEVFRGATCDNGAPLATVGPRSEANGVKVHHTKGVHVKDGIVASIRVVGHHKGDFDFDDFGFDEF